MVIVRLCLNDEFKNSMLFPRLKLKILCVHLYGDCLWIKGNLLVKIEWKIVRY